MSQFLASLHPFSFCLQEWATLACVFPHHDGQSKGGEASLLLLDAILLHFFFFRDRTACWENASDVVGLFFFFPSYTSRYRSSFRGFHFMSLKFVTAYTSVSERGLSTSLFLSLPRSLIYVSHIQTRSTAISNSSILFFTRVEAWCREILCSHCGDITWSVLLNHTKHDSQRTTLSSGQNHCWWSLNTGANCPGMPTLIWTINISLLNEVKAIGLISEKNKG